MNSSGFSFNFIHFKKINKYCCRHTITYDAPSSSSSTSNSPLSTHDDLYKRLLRENVIIKTREDTVEGMVIAVDYQRDKPDK